MREALLKIKIGETGYVWVLDSKGNYVVSQDGKRDGQNIMGPKMPTADCLSKTSLKRRLIRRKVKFSTASTSGKTRG
jgi:hypothetical protein